MIDRKGFTIVELLIVIVVIAILAAISIVAYSGIQDRAADTIIKADLANIAKKLELTRIDLGRYPETAAEMPEYKISKESYDQTANNTYICFDKVNQLYAFGARSKSKKGFIKTTSELQEGVSIAASYTCAAIGKTWANDATTFTIQGYVSGGFVPTNGWNPAWKWTQ